MKVVQLLYSGMGGHGSVAFSLLDADTTSQWEPVMGFLGIEPFLPTYAQLCEERAIEHRYFSAIPGKPWRTWPSIWRWLRTCRPDAVVLHSATALLPCFLHARRWGIPLVVVEHQPNALKRRVEWIFSYLAMLMADRVIVLTQSYTEELKGKLGIFYRMDKVHLIPNGIDTQRFTPLVMPSISNRSVRLGMAARFTTKKRQDVLVEMILKLRQYRPEIDWQLSLAGSGESWQFVRQMVQAHSLGGCISLPGQLGEPELISWYQSLEVYLHASEGETLSTSLLQAMASGLPIVASNVPGIQNLLCGEPVCGVLVKDQNPLGFAEAVIELVNNNARAEALAQNGRQLVVSSYSQNDMFARYMQALTID